MVQGAKQVVTQKQKKQKKFHQVNTDAMISWESKNFLLRFSAIGSEACTKGTYVTSFSNRGNFKPVNLREKDKYDSNQGQTNQG